MQLKALQYPAVWHAIVGFLVVHPSHTQAPVPGLTVFSKQFVDQKVILCTKGALLTALLLRSHEISLTQVPFNPLFDNCGEGLIEHRKTRDRPVILGLVSLVVLGNQGGYSLRQPIGYRVSVLNQEVIIPGQITVKTDDMLDPKSVNLIWPRRLPVPNLFETHGDLIV